MPRKSTGGKAGRPKKIHSGQLSEMQQAALAIEITKPKDFEIGGISGAELARRIGASRQMVSKIRKDPVYRAAFHQQLFEALANEVGAQFASENRTAKEAREEAFASINKNKKIHIEAFVNKHWTGPVQWPGSDEVFTTPEALTRYIIENDSLPAEIVKDTRARLKDR